MRLLPLFTCAAALATSLALLAAPARAEEPPAPSPAVTETAGQPMPSALSMSVDGRAVSEQPVTVMLEGVDAPLTAGTEAAMVWSDHGNFGREVAVVGSDGIARFSVTGWKAVQVTGAWGPYSTNATVEFAPARSPIAFPAQAPRPRGIGPADPPASGEGANPSIERLGSQARRILRGLSWSSGCPSLDQLRRVRVNYWGVDGYRHRGEMIVRSDVAQALTGAFTDMYKIAYRFHSIHPVDRYGAGSAGPGADDYASMRAGNTSVFNCRYVVGKESSRSWSPHMGGRAVDINPWENPYVARGGVQPDSFWLDRRASTPLGLTASSPVVSIMRKHGWAWGGSYRDYHHFDWRG